jgi:hypothetical protein
MTEAQAATTRYCARVIGPLMLIIGAIVTIRFDDLVLMIPAMLQDAPLAFVTGIFTLVLGLTLLAAHHHFGSAAAIAITIIAGLTIVRAITLLFAPDLVASLSNTMIRSGPAILAAGGVSILIGAWLTYAGWFAKRAGSA